MSYVNTFLNYITFSVLLKGARLKNESRVLRLLHIILLFSCFGSHLYLVFRWFENQKLEDLSNDRIFRSIADASGTLFGILFPLWFIYKKKSIVDFTRRLFRLLPNQSQSKVIKVSLVMFILDIAIILLHASLKVWNDYMERKQFLLCSSMFEVIQEFSTTFIVTGCCIYTSFLYLLHTMIGYQFELIKLYLKKVEEPDLLLINNVLHVVLKSLKNFESNFSFLPLSWFSNTFFFTSVNILVMSTQVEVTSKIVFTTIFVLENVATFTVIILLSRLKKDWQKHCDMLYYNLAAVDHSSVSHGSFVRLSIARNLDSISSFRMTAMSLFSLDLSVILSLAGTVLTCTVLFIQLTR